MDNKLSVVILTLNEEKHIARCIESIKDIASEIIIVDSFSTDSTLEIAQSYNVDIYQNKWVNYATQFNWALDHCDIKSKWIMRLDADEIITPDLAKIIKDKLYLYTSDITGLTVNRQIYFLGKWIRYGDIYPVTPLRIWRNGQGRCEDRWMDEHIILKGKIDHLDADIADINLNNLTWWTDKHNHYASREAIDLLLSKYSNSLNKEKATIGQQAKYKRWIKENIYSKLPLGLRAFLYFIYRYIIRLGFLDGWQGLAFHVLQGFWYRFLVDLKVHELETIMQDKKQTLEEVVYSEFGYTIGKSK